MTIKAKIILSVIVLALCTGIFFFVKFQIGLKHGIDNVNSRVNIDENFLCQSFSEQIKAWSAANKITVPPECIAAGAMK